jgi:hypothetical protein
MHRVANGTRPLVKAVVTARDRRCVDCGGHDLLEFDHVPEFDQRAHVR